MKQAIEARGAVVEVPLKTSSLRSIKYAAFALTAGAYVELESAPGRVRVRLAPKAASGKAAVKELVSRFREELELEGIRGPNEAVNRRLREHILRLALRGEPDRSEPEAEAGLTEEQQKELDRLIAEVEAEIKNEPGKAQKDPLGVTRTWEERFGRSRVDGND